MRAGLRLFPVILVLAFFAGCAPKSAPPPAPTGDGAFEAGTAKFQSGDYAGAAEQFSLAAEQEPGKAETYYLLGLSLHKSLYVRSEAAYRKALSLDPGYVPSMEALGILYFSIGDFARAGEWLEKAAGLDGKSAEASVCLGDIYFFEGRCPQALAAYEKASVLDPALASAPKRAAMAKKSCGKAVSVPAAPSGAPAAAPAANKSAPKVIDLNDI